VRKLLLGLLILLIAAYPFAIYFGLQSISPRYVALIIVFVLAARFVLMPKGHTRNLPAILVTIAGIALCLWVMVFNHVHALRLYPVIINVLLLGVFGYSLWHGPTVIEKLARLTTPNLPPDAITYTRNVTAVWCVFFVLNGLTSLYTVYFTSLKIWTLYNGFIAYLLIGALFVLEFGVRCVVKKRISHKALNLCAVISTLHNQTVFISQRVPVSAHRFSDNIHAITTHINNTPHQRWALCYTDTVQFSAALFAVLACGREPVLLPNNLPGTLKNFKAEYDAVLTETTELESHKTDLPQTLNPNQAISIFTSGSTGEPKKITRTLGQLNAEINALEALFTTKMATSDTYSTVSHQHIYGLIFTVLWPLAASRTAHVPMLEYPEQLETLLKQNPSITLISSPAFLSRLNDTVIKTQGFTVFSSGSLLQSEAAMHVYNSFNTSPIEVLGSTETSGVAVRQQANNIAWTPLVNVALSLQKDTKCLRVSSPYFTHDTPFMMGDGARFHNDGTFELLGRQDRIVKIEGKRVSLPEVEAALKTHEAIADAYVLALRNTRDYLGAIIVLNAAGKAEHKDQGTRVFNNALKAHLLTTFDRIVVPKKIRHADVIPVNAQGKRVLSGLQKLFKDKP
jgi:uncharacterized membrane protein/acyl-CoA synthetase (AMP-forming)/AMP-acid ligase II